MTESLTGFRHQPAWCLARPDRLFARANKSPLTCRLIQSIRMTPLCFTTRLRHRFSLVAGARLAYSAVKLASNTLTVRADKSLTPARDRCYARAANLPGYQGMSMLANTRGGKSILVVEDNEIARLGLIVVLNRPGYAVASAQDGAAVLELLRGAQVPDLVLLGMMIPVVDGWSFLDQRRRDPALARVPVIITTALGVASTEWATSLGAAAWVRKPIEVDELLTEVRRLCG